MAEKYAVFTVGRLKCVALSEYKAIEAKNKELEADLDDWTKEMLDLKAKNKELEADLDDWTKEMLDLLVWQCALIVTAGAATFIK